MPLAAVSIMWLSLGGQALGVTQRGHRGAVLEAQNAFVDRATKGDLAAVHLFLAGGANPSAVDENGTTALFGAAWEGRTEVVRDLLDAGADVDGRSIGWRTVMLIQWTRIGSSPYSGKYPSCGTGAMEEMRKIAANDKVGATPLMAASFRGHSEIAQMLLERGADVNARSFEDSTALIFAVVTNQAEIVKLLIAAGGDLNARASDQQTPVMIASYNRGKPESLPVLLDAGADPNTQNKYGHTALMGAAYTDAQAIIRVLITHGADVNKPSSTGATALGFAVDGDSVEAARLLIEAGADVETRENDGSTLLMLAAARYKGLGMTRLLIDNKVDITATDRYGVRTALLSAELTSNQDSAALLRQEGATLSTDARLLLAAHKGKTDTVVDLLAEGASVNAKGRYGRTPLSYAAAAGHLEIVRMLLKNGAEPNICPDDGEPPLLEAAFWGHVDVVQALIDSGSDVNAPLTAKPYVPAVQSNGTTALMRAAIRGQIAVARVLLNHGADIEVKNDEGETALSIADRFGNIGYIRLLNKGQPNR